MAASTTDGSCAVDRGGLAGGLRGRLARYGCVGGGAGVAGKGLRAQHQIPGTVPLPAPRFPSKAKSEMRPLFFEQCQISRVDPNGSTNGVPRSSREHFDGKALLHGVISLNHPIYGV